MNAKETLEHMMNECEHRVEERWEIIDLLNEDARGLPILKRIMDIRKSQENAKNIVE